MLFDMSETTLRLQESLTEFVLLQSWNDLLVESHLGRLVSKQASLIRLQTHRLLAAH